MSSTSTMREVFEKQQQTALRLRSSTAKERNAKIRRLRDAVLGRLDVWHEAAWADFKKPKAEVETTELLPIAMEANDHLRHLAQWMKPQRVPASVVSAGLSGHIRHEPRGRCLIISPWNYPINLTFAPLICAIGAGNTAMLKPSEMTPHLSAAMAKLVKEVFSEDEVALFEGDAQVSQALLELPFDHIFFTGSPAIGKVVMTAAAKHLTSVTLELGGKSPSIVDEGADLKLAALNVLWGKCTNAGQTCIAPDHVYVHARVKDRFLEECRAVLAKTHDPKGEHYARIVNARHLGRLKGLLDDAKAKGGKVLLGGTVDDADSYIAPTLIEGMSPDARIMHEEVFGPLLPVITFTDLSEVIQRINADPKPLALYLYSKNERHVQRVLAETSSGGACINHCLIQYMHPNLPFGGVNNSGLGSSHGIFGFKAFSHERAVVRTQVALAAKLFAPGKVPDAMRTAVNKLWKAL